jgi:hypothetical protein
MIEAAVKGLDVTTDEGGVRYVAAAVEYARDGSSVHAHPIEVARTEVSRLQRSGVEASWAPDHDDRSLAWIYRGEVQS